MILFTSRIDGLFKSGALAYDKRPVWFDVVKAFPPKWHDYLAPPPKVENKPIFYSEDVIRAKFFKCFGSPGIIDLTDPDRVPPSEVFIENYVKLAQSKPLSQDELFETTRQRLNELGYGLTYRRGQEVEMPLKKSIGGQILEYVHSPDSSSNSFSDEKNV